MPENGRSQAEQAPLLDSQPSTTAPQIETDDVESKEDTTNQSVTAARGTAISLSLFVLVFLQGSVLL